MKPAYKVAIIVAATLLLIAVIYHFNQTAPKPTGRASMPQVPGIVNKPAPANRGAGSVNQTVKTSPEDNESASELLKRVQARIEEARLGKDDASVASNTGGSSSLTPNKTTNSKATTSKSGGDSNPAASVLTIDGPLDAVSKSRTDRAAKTGAVIPATSITNSKNVVDNALGSTARPSTSITPPVREGSMTPVLNRPAPVPSRAAKTSYIIQPRDTFSSIAMKIYGSERYWVDIAHANPLVDPTRLLVDQKIRLPRQEDLHSKSTPALPGPGNEVNYTVRSGDSLYTIARQFYNDGELSRTIFNANRNRIGPNPDRLKAGARLVIPPAPNLPR